MDATGVGPDLVMAGAARSGTSYLAAVLGQLPQVDPCAVKEPNYFSREHARGPEWYDGLFRPREPHLLRLDASMSYTFPHFPEALARLAAQSPRVVVVYSIRDPLSRLVSHFRLHRDYFDNEPASTLGEALERTDVYHGASDYAAWLPRLEHLFGPDRLVVTPFPVVTGHTAEVVEVVAEAAGLTTDKPVAVGVAARHRNQVVEYRHPGVRVGRRVVRRAGLYPTVRRLLGPDRLRLLRSWATRPVAAEPVVESLGTCTPDQRRRLDDLHESASAAALDALIRQDARLGLSWASAWSCDCPRTVGPALREVS